MASTSKSQHELLELDDHLRKRARIAHGDPPSESQQRPKHTIFLSHSGAQKAFVEQLYEDLKRRGQSPFFDQSPDSLPKGEVFASLILEAAKQCVVAVVVLSKEFVQSKWCMLELSTFVEAQRTSNPNLRLFPLFYKLEVAELKDTKAMEEKWEEMAVGDERNKPGVWRDAVRVLARGNGEVFSKYDGSEVKYRKAIVDAVCRLCRPFVESTVPSMVGRDRLCNIMEGEFEKLATKQHVKGAKILGLYGTGGMGKSFICKALCEHFDDEYSGRLCYVEYSEGISLELLKLILEDLTDIDGKALKRIKTEEQANDLLKHLLPKQDVFLALDNVQGDLLDWTFLTYLSAKSKIVVASRTLENVQKVVGNKALCLPCPTLTVPDAVKLFLQSAGCTQSLIEWTKEEMEILKKCIELSFLQNDFNKLSLEHGLDNPLETDEEQENFMKCIKLSLISEDENSHSLLHSDSSEKYGHHNPLVLVAMGTTIKEVNTIEPTQLINKCMRIEHSQHHKKRRLSDIFKTSPDTLTADEKQMFLDVALFYPIVNLDDVEFVDMLGLLINWLEIVDGSPRREILHKIRKLKDFNRAFHGHKVHELFANIFLVFNEEICRLKELGEMDDLLIPYLDKMIEIFILKGDSLKDKPISRRAIGLVYMIRGTSRLRKLNFRGALEDLQRANQFHPNCLRINLLLGTTYFMMEQYQNALNFLNIAISLFPTTNVGAQGAIADYAESFAVRANVKLEFNDLAGAKMDIDFATALCRHSECVQNCQLHFRLITDRINIKAI